MSIVLQSTSGGSVTINEPTTASNFTATMPAATGTVAVSGNMPAFSAYDSAGTSVASGTFTKLAFATEEFDTNNNFASSRFTPTVAGYYQINGYYLTAAASVGLMSCQIYKNGAVYKYGSQTPNSVNVAGSVVSSMVYMNGTTDYVEIYAYQASGGTYTSYVSGLVTSFFNGSMVRAA